MKNLKSVYRLKQFMCALLVCVMTVSLLPVSAFATQAEETAPVVEEVATESDQTGLTTVSYGPLYGLAMNATAQATGGSIAEFWETIPERFILTNCTVLDLTLVDYVPNTPVDVVCSIPYDMDTIEGTFALYTVDSEGNRTRVYDYELFFEDSLGLNTTFPVFTFTMGGPGRIVFGFLNSDVPADTKPAELEVNYSGSELFFVQDEENEDILDEIRAGLTAMVTCTDGTRYVDTTLNEDYTISVNMTEVGYQTVTVTLNRKMGTVEDVFSVCFCPTQILESYNGVTVETDTPGVLGTSVRKVKSPSIAIDHLLENYVAYDISLHHALGDTFNGTAAVTLPIPEGVTNPKVYYVSDDGKTITDMKATDNGDGTVTFITDHFSTFIVGNGNTEITVADPIPAPGTYTAKKDAYVLINSAPTAEKQYLIVSSNTAGPGFALKENQFIGSSVTIKKEGTNTYIETTDTSIMWNVTPGLKFQSEKGKYYLRGDNRLTFTKNSNDATTWYAETSDLYTIIRYNSNYSYSLYLYNYNNGWGVSYYDYSNVYFYEYRDDALSTTTTADGTFSIKGDALAKVVERSSPDTLTGTLNSTLSFTPNGGNPISVSMTGTPIYTLVENGDPNGIINRIEGNTVHFTGNAGIALVQVSYTGTDASDATYTVTDYILVTATHPDYQIDITEKGESVTKVLSKKGVRDGDNLQLGYTLSYSTADGSTQTITPAAGTLKWSIPEDQRNIATVDNTGKVTFKGVTGRVNVTVSYQTGTGAYVTDTIVISANTSNVTTPLDGTSDFPEYPNEGSIRFDKTASSVGTFSETGTVQVELSLTGVPFHTNNELDVVIMMDMSSSMDDIGATQSAKNAAKAALATIVKNEDGSFNNNRVAVYAFNGWPDGNNAQSTWETNNVANSPVEHILGDSKNYSIDELAPFQTYTNTTLNTANTKINNAATGAGTNYAAALKQCYKTLEKYKPDGRQQFVIFMSDGAPSTGFAYFENGQKKVYYKQSELGNDGSIGLPKIKNVQEYYSTLMKQDGVTIYTVALKLPSNDAKTVLANIATPDTDGTQHAFVLDNDVSELTNIFKGIVNEILEAATDVVVQDKIADNYTMIFDIPEGEHEVNGLENTEMYIELKDYTLDSNHERTDQVKSLLKVYMGRNDNGTTAQADNPATRADDTYYAATRAGATNGNYKCPDLEFTTEVEEEGDPRYYKVVADNYQAGKYEIVIDCNGTKYLFMPKGDGTHNVKSGVYAFGHVNEYLGENYLNTSNDLVIVTPYFCYSAATKMLAWTVDAIRSTELVLSYFLHLDESSNEFTADPGAHPTNDWATLNYKNFDGVSCEQEFPIPQMTWDGAQVSYVFYLVNKDGQPLNRSGQVVDFANASFITKVFTHSITWKEADTLNVKYLADDLLPESYEVYDEDASYTIRVYAEQTNDQKDHFIIGGGNVKNKETTKVYNTLAGKKFSTPRATPYYSGTDETKGVDFSSTVVAFAVLWEQTLVPDTVVLDYGLDVVIDVVANDPLQNTVSGISFSNVTYGATQMNTGLSPTRNFTSTTLTLDRNFDISLDSENSIRIKQKNMRFTEPFTFYYESPVEYYEGSTKTSGFMYSSVTVIPAANIYYEESFVSYPKGSWSNDGTPVTKVQEADRPGTAAENAGAYDPDNLYGFDKAYKDSPQLSLGSAKKTTVNVTTGAYGSAPEAEFTFTGTGFDIVSLTSNTSGTIVVTAVNTENNKTYRKSVDTYYGYSYGNYQDQNGQTITGWYPNTGASDTLWQVPVIKMLGLPYGTYTVTIQVAYLETLDHQAKGSYSFWLDGVRIYDPAGPNTDPLTAYSADKEKSPSYATVRDMLVYANSLTSGGKGVGVVFVDGKAETKSDEIAIYAYPGPNHETYLAEGQGIAFKLVCNTVRLDTNGKFIPPIVHLGAKLAKGSSATLSMVTETTGTDGKITTNVSEFATLATASDMYYDLGSKLKWSLKDGSYVSDPIVLVNNSSGIISLTNLKVTEGVSWNRAFLPNPDYITVTPVVDQETVTFATRTLRQLTVASKPVFGDVPSGSWYANAVDYVTGHGLMVGAGSSFLPTGQVSRAQVVQTLFSMAGKPAFTATKSFSDVAAGSWYADAVNWAAAGGVAAGSGNGTFAPDANVTREQLAMFLYAYSGAPEASADLSAFADGAKVSSWAVDAVEWAVSRHLISGKSGNLLDPQGTATRAELAQILMNFHKG